MTSPTGPSGGEGPVPGTAPRQPPGFTLIELILVMAMLLSVLSLAAPSLGRFFRGRGLDSEAQRFLALTRYGQSRAVAEGVPMVLWVDREQRRYGLEAEFHFLDRDERAVEFVVDEDVELEVAPFTLTRQSTPRIPQTLPPPAPWSRRPEGLRNLEWFRFTPDGFLGETNPAWVAFRPRGEPEAPPSLWIAPGRHRLQYELRTEEPPLPR